MFLLNCLFVRDPNHTEIAEMVPVAFGLHPTRAVINTDGVEKSLTYRSIVTKV